MKPIAPLMIEHRLIERMVDLLKKESAAIATGKKPDNAFIYAAVDFFQTYADRTHHGKEEDILFRELAKKQLTEEHKKIMDELKEEHARARMNVRGLLDAGRRYAGGAEGAAPKIRSYLDNLIELYPAHIEKEDRHFFIPVMEYFTAEEQEEMLREFYEFDGKMIHEKYKKVVEQYQETNGRLGSVSR